MTNPVNTSMMDRALNAIAPKASIFVTASLGEVTVITGADLKQAANDLVTGECLTNFKEQSPVLKGDTMIKTAKVAAKAGAATSGAALAGIATLTAAEYLGAAAVVATGAPFVVAAAAIGAGSVAFSYYAKRNGEAAERQAQQSLIQAATQFHNGIQAAVNP